MRMHIQHGAACAALLCIIVFGDCRSVSLQRRAIQRGDFAAAAEYLDSLVLSLMKKHRLPGIAVNVVHEGRILYSRCHGIARINEHAPVTDETVFMAGSLTKSFTALAVMRLIKDGRVRADADIRTYIPEFSIRSHGAPSKPVTVRHLLTHTSGLMIDYYPRFTGEKRYGDRELLSLLKDEYLCFPPGTAVKYSNIGYKLLGMMVERVTGEPFERSMSRFVLAPTGMIGSSYKQTGGEKMASGHDGDRGNSVMPFLDIGDNASSGLLTTLNDLAAFLRYMAAERQRAGPDISGPEAVASVLKNADRSVDTFYDTVNLYSTGWYLDFYRFRGSDGVMSNSGNVNGFSSELAYIPDAKLGMTVLSNSSLGWKADIEITARGLQAFLDAVHGTAPGREEEKEWKWPSLLPPPDDVTGRYAAFGIMIDIFNENNSLHARFKGPAAQLVPRGNGVYTGEVCLLIACLDVSRFTEYDAVRFRFFSNRAGETFLSMDASYGESFFSFPLHRVGKPAIPEGFRRNYGTWELPEGTGYPGVLKLYLPSNRLWVYEKDGWSVLETVTWMGEGLLTLEPLSDSLARFAGSGEIISFTDNELTFIGLRFRRKQPGINP